MKKIEKKIEQDIDDVEGDVISPIVSDVRAGRDVSIHISKQQPSDISEREFEIDINPAELFLTRLGRMLLSRLGYHKFLTTFILILSGSIGLILFESIRVLQGVYSTMVYYRLFGYLLISMFSVSILAYGKSSKCKYCGKLYATVPIKRSVVDKFEYKGVELYKIKELRKCELCGEITLEERTESEFED